MLSKTSKPLLFLVMLIFLYLPEYALAQNRIDISLLVGEWSEKGKCNSSRYVFTKNGRFQTLAKKTGRWKTFFNGTYTRKNSNSLSLTDKQFVDTLVISSLTAKSLSAKWFIAIGEDEMIPVYWQRCSLRR